jgi:type I restriction enzyme S subunit
MVPLGEVLAERQEVPSVDALTRGEVRILAKIGFDDGRIQLRTGSETRTNMILIRPGDLVISGINAAKGAIAIYDQGNTEPIAATIHYGSYTPNKEKVDVRYLWWLLRSGTFRELLVKHVPGGIKTELKAARLLPIPIPLPPLPEQRRIVTRIDELAAKIEEARSLKDSVSNEVNQMLLADFSRLLASAETRPMSEVAPIIRRSVGVEDNSIYPELGIRSFGKGTFHKPALSAIEVGTKKLFRIEPGDLIFNNVFAWEGAVAVARPEDAGRFGSHRFITCIAKKGIARAKFLCFYFLTSEGLEKLGEASPGGAGRNRTLGLEALSEINVPLPAYEKQMWFEDLQATVEVLNHVQAESAAELDSMLPSILDKAFKGKLGLSA